MVSVHDISENILLVPAGNTVNLKEAALPSPTTVFEMEDI